MAGTSIKFRWKPVPEVHHYVLTVWPIQHPLHPQSGYSAQIARVDVQSTELTVNLNDFEAPIYLHPESFYGWCVQDAEDKENNLQGQVAQSEDFVVISHGGLASIQTESPGSNYMRDEQVEASLGLCVQQPYQPSDDSQVWLQIVGVGRGTALQAGLQPHDEIRLANGKSVKKLSEIHSPIEALPKGVPLLLTIERYDSDLKRRVEKVISVGKDLKLNGQ